VTKVGPYELGDELGRGAAGTVYRARDPEGAWVALKRLRSREALQRFPRERLIQAELGREGGFVPVLDAGADAEGAWLVMPLLAGGTLRDRLRVGRLSVAEVTELGVLLGDALGRAHARGFVHRDLKPENVLFDEEGRPLIADLGIAKHLGGDAQLGLSRSLSNTGETRGTLGYLAPECVKDSKHASPAADVYALGAVLYECAAGRAPFEGTTVVELLSRLVSGRHVPLGRVRPDLPAPLRDVIERCLAADPSGRYPEGASLAEALRVAEGEGATRARRRRRRLLALGAGLLLVGVLGLGGVGLRNLGEGPKPLATQSLQPKSGVTAPKGEGGSMNRSLCLALTLFACTPLVAQEQQPVRPQPIRVAEVNGNGHAETWDGRVFVITRGLPNGGGIGWAARVLRPERIGLDGEGRPVFGPGVFSPVVPLETETGASAAGLTMLNAVALAPWPGIAQNPYPSNAQGAPLSGGAFETYDLLVSTQRYVQNDDRLGRLRYRVVVRSPHTRDAAIERVERVSGYEPMTQANGQPLRGIEPTMTFDAHLLLWQGKPANDGSIDALVYSYNQNPGAARGWSAPKSIADMYHVDRGTQIAGLRFDERFPLAERQLHASEGTPYARGQLYRGAYPWISRDGSELFHTSTIAGQAGVNRARRGGQAVIGRLTGWAMRHLDGPLNPDREQTVRLFTSSPGLTPGMWTPFRDAPQRIPAGAGKPLYPIFGSNTANYADVDLSDAADGEYTLVLHLNEVVDAAGRIDAGRTPDSSGRARAGRLQGGAAFPQERGMPDANIGHVGQAILFPQDGGVRVQDLERSRDALTVSLWIKRLASLAGDPGNRFLVAANHPRAWHLILEEDGRVHVTVTSGGVERRTGAIGQPLPLDTWAHVSFTYEASQGRLQTWIDGTLAHTRDFGAGQIDPGEGYLLLGPAGQRPAAPTVPASLDVLLLDELAISRVVRTPRELRAAAFRRTATPGPGPALGVPLPQGIPASALKVPQGAVTSDAAAELGELLFFEPRLSFDGSVSCASCHQPALGFTDGLPVARGVRGVMGERNTPTILNRALSSAQFLDGRASSLEEQATLPIEHPAEMRLPLSEALNRISSSPTYVARFQAAFGRGPDKATLSAALSAFQRRQVFAGSRVDRYLAGDAGALSPAEVRGRNLFHGKARCVACHSGPNFSDEAFHNTASTLDRSDGGRADATGRASDRGRFKTPTLRAISRTAPYLHDGSVATLAEVIELYDRGGLRRDGRDTEVRALGLSAQEKADLEAFLRALEGPSTARPAPALPSDVRFTVPPASPQEVWVGRAYQALLGRAASPAEAATRANDLAAGALPADMARSISRSPEALRYRVRGLYRDYLKRQADPGGLASHVAAAQGGAALAEQEIQFLLSQEYQRKAPSVEAYIAALYRDVLGRAPDLVGKLHHEALLRARPDLRPLIVRTFVRSQERHERWAEAVYRACAGRAPTAGERAQAVRDLEAGLPLEELPVRVLGAVAP
jgi:cytochrome c peroxidase